MINTIEGQIKTRGYILLLFLCFFSSRIAGSDIYFNHLTRENGMPSGSVNDLVEDQLGFIWIATEEGVCRFDGSDVKTFNAKDMDNHRLMNSFVRQLAIGSDTSLWMVTNNALVNFDIVTEEVKAYYHDAENNNSIAFGKVKMVIPSKNEGVWVIHNKNISHVNQKEGLITRFILETEIKAGIEDEHGVLWLLMIDKTILRFNDQLEEMPLISGLKSKYYNDVPFEGAVSSASGGVWVFDKNIYHIKSSVGGIEIANYDLGLQNDQVNKIIFLDEDHLMVSTNNSGLIIFDNHTKKVIKRLVHDPMNERSLKGNNVFDIEKDKQGRVWVVAGQCLHLYQAGGHGFTRYPPVLSEKGHPNLISNKYIADGIIYPVANDIIMFLTRNGVDYFNPGMVKFNFVEIPGVSEFTCVMKDYHGDIWFGANDGVHIIDLESGEKKKYTGLFMGDPFTTVYSMLMIDSVHYLIGSSGLHLVRYNREKEQLINVHRFTPPGHSPRMHLAGWLPGEMVKGEDGTILLGLQESVSSVHADTLLGLDFEFSNWYDLTSPFMRVWAICEESPGLYWVGFNNGLLRIDLKENSTRQYLYSPDDPSSPGGNSVKSILKDGSGNIWIGYEGGGLSKFNKREDSFTNYTKKHGLPSNTLFNLLEDNQGDIWISTNMGLSKFNVKTKRFVNFTVKDGIGNNRFSLFGAYKDKSTGELFFSNIKGFVHFKPENIKPLNIDPRIYVTDLLFDGESVFPGEKRNGMVVLEKSMIFIDKIRFSYKENNVLIKFAALDYSAPEGIIYNYRLSGMSDQWVKAGSNSNIVSFFNIPPGKYELTIKATNSDGIWASSPRKLEIIVTPPFWQTWWFRSFSVLMIIVGGLSFYMIRTRQLERRNEELELNVQARTAEIAMQKEELEIQTEQLSETNATKDKLFSIIAHDLRNPIHAMSSLHNILVKELKNKVGDKIFALLVTLNSSSGSLSNLLENLLNWSRSQREGISISKQAICVHDLVLKTKNLLLGNLEQKKIYLHNQCDNSHFILVDVNMMQTVIRNLVSNAIKFTPKGGEITIESVQEKDQLKIKITDTGVGMSAMQVKNLFKIDKAGNFTSGTDGEEGTGLGLFICKDFVEKNDGSIAVSSEQGKGTEFTISLPLVSKSSDGELYTQVIIDEKEEKSATVFPGSNPGMESKKEKDTLPLVLVVDDNKALLDASEALLMPHFNVILAINGCEGWEIAKGQIPDLIITDLVMPRMNGYELVEKLRADPATSHIPIIMLTAESGEKQILEGYRKEVDDYILKPFNPEILIGRINNLLVIRAKLRDLFNSSPAIALENDLLSDTDKIVFKQIKKIVLQNLNNPDFNTGDLCESVGMSRTGLYKKLKFLTGMTVNQFIVFIRLNESVRYLSGTSMNISEIAYNVGFNDSAYFTRCFKKQFNISPTEYREKHQE